MKIRSKEPLGTRSVPAPRTISLSERALADRDEPQDDGTRAHTGLWVRPGNYAWAMGVLAMGLSLRFYYMREMLVSLALFSLLFFLLSLVVLSVLCFCYAGQRAAIWAGLASRAAIALMQQDLGTKFARVLVADEGRNLSSQRREVRTRIQTERQS